MRPLLLMFAIACMIVSCSSNNDIPKGILKKEKMQLVLWDVLRADVFTFQFITKDSSKNPELEAVKLQKQIFAAHKITKEDFDKSYAFYKSHPEIMQPMLDSIINKYTREKESYLQRTQAAPAKKDSITPQ
ncbi:MAG: DUF4296 domain-containing protein [Ferruginibacter sp.]